MRLNITKFIIINNMLLQSTQDQEGKISSLYDSTNVLASKYDPKTKKMAIIFNNGGQYLYENVSSSTFQHFQSAKSQGSAVHSVIKGHSGTKVSTIDVSSIIEDIKNLKK